MPREADARLRTRDAVALGLLHGPAELLPISSSAHVTLVPWLLRWPYAQLDPQLRKAFEVALHAGTLAALLVGTRDELAAELRGVDACALRRLALAALPAAVAGLAFEQAIARRLGSPPAIAAGLAAGAVALAAADLRGRTGRDGAPSRAGVRRAASGPSHRVRSDATDLDALLLGLAQACALAPGISRSGATLTVARARGFARADASALSRRVALPVVAGAAGLKAKRLARDGLPTGAAAGFATGAAASFGGSLVAIRVLRAGVQPRPAWPWAGYRIALAALVCRRLRSDRRERVADSTEIRRASDVSPPSPAAQ